MKTFKSIAIVKHPLSVVSVALRDDIQSIAPFMDDVRSVTAVSRSQLTSELMSVVNLWESSIQLPEFANGLLAGKKIRWIDRAEWRLDMTQCNWVIEPQFLEEAAQCQGQTVFTAAMGSRGTKITFEGCLTVNSTKVSRVPSLLSGTVSSLAETFVTALIPKNFRKLVDALTLFLDSTTGGK